MYNLKLSCVATVAVIFSSLTFAADCDAVSTLVIERLANTADVPVDVVDVDAALSQQSFSVDLLSILDVVINIEETLDIKLSDEDVVDPVVELDEEGYGPELRKDITVKEFQNIVYHTCVQGVST
ncbi:hypothetical protein [Thaumasiovibrio subtropicus]|uniref:hypothetical protein n=1 Tax=Thaumasiovibrio subtropicus TaxID=1891207 RepID=UPI000B35CD50|nr:hypothetical protein [Thaumasiovibrio subtropicus]